MVLFLRVLLVLACGLSALPLLLRTPDVISQIQTERRAATKYQHGQRFQLLGRLDEAAAEYRAAISVMPSATAPVVALAEVEFRRGNFEETVRLYERVLDEYPYAYMATLHRGVGLAQLRRGRLEEARDALRKAVEYDPADWFAHYLLGHVALRLGAGEEARAAWARVLELNPTFDPALRRLKLLDESQ